MSRFLPGLVSVTFRRLSPLEILRLCRECGLNLIEWGGDVHVPAGDLERALEVRELTQQAGVRTICYGSYWRAGQGDPFGPVLETAWTLGAPKIRVWAGVKGSLESSEAQFKSCVKELEAASILAAERGMRITVEIHPGTWTDLPSGAHRLLDWLGDKIDCHWQPSPRLTFAENCSHVARVKPWVKGFHVFQWRPTATGADRLPLAEGWDEWRQFLSLAPEGEHPLLLEFVKGDDPDQLKRDAQTLLDWIERLKGP